MKQIGDAVASPAFPSPTAMITIKTFKVSSLSLFLLVAKSPIAENVRSASTEVGLRNCEERIYDKFSPDSPVYFS